MVQTVALRVDIAMLVRAVIQAVVVCVLKDAPVAGEDLDVMKVGLTISLPLT